MEDCEEVVEREVETEFQRGIRSFGYMIMQVTFLLIIFVFFINALYMRSALDSLLEDLARTMEYPFYYHQIGHTIQYLKRAGLISFDWQQRTIKREKSLKEYLTKQLMTSELWPKIAPCGF